MKHPNNASSRPMAKKIEGKELFRKSIHTLGFTILFAADLLGLANVIIILSSISIIYLIEEFVRVKGGHLPILTSFTTKAARNEEIRGVALQPIYLSIGVLVSLVLFPYPISYGAIAVTTLGDGVSAMAGRPFGKTRLPFNRNKTLEAMLLGIAASILGGAVFLPIHLIAMGATAGMLVEATPLHISDNLTMPLASGVVMLLMELTF